MLGILICRHEERLPSAPAQNWNIWIGSAIQEESALDVQIRRSAHLEVGIRVTVGDQHCLRGRASLATVRSARCLRRGRLSPAGI
jgi:hypothetical protein